MAPRSKPKVRHAANPSAPPPNPLPASSSSPPIPLPRPPPRQQPHPPSSSPSQPRPTSKKQQGQLTAPPPPPPPNPHPRPPYELNASRVARGDMYFRTTANSEWVQVDPLSIANRGGNETLTDITFNGGIEVCQLVNDQSMDYGKMWKIRWEPGQYDQVNVQEFQREKMDKLHHIAVQFRPLAQPTGSLVDHPSTQNRIALSAGGSLAAANPPFLAGSGSQPARFPLARLSSHFVEDGYTTCLFVFPRNKLRSKGQLRWIWAAACTFLRGANSWTAPPTSAETDRLRNQDLDEFASSPYLAQCPFTFRDATRGKWLMSRDDTSHLMDVPPLPAQAEAIAAPERIALVARKRQMEGLQLENEHFKRLKTALPLLMAENQQNRDELQRLLGGGGPTGAERQQQQQQLGDAITLGEAQQLQQEEMQTDEQQQQEQQEEEEEQQQQQEEQEPKGKGKEETVDDDNDPLSWYE